MMHTATTVKKILASVRPNIRKLTPYSSARSLYLSGVLLDANENPFNLYGDDVPVNRYPDGRNMTLRTALAKKEGLSADDTFAGNGSDELIDLLFRIFCAPGHDNVILCPPTYGMYKVSADINDIAHIEVPLDREFDLDTTAVLAAITDHTRMIFICSPNNPTGNLISKDRILTLLDQTDRLVVVDEAYIEFAKTPSLAPLIRTYPNLIVSRTLSKAHAAAGIRLGYGFAVPEIITLLQTVKPPYNLNILTIQRALSILEGQTAYQACVQEIVQERDWLISELNTLPAIRRVLKTDANFLIFEISNAKFVFDELVKQGIIVRDRSKERGLANCLRLTVGTPQENRIFLSTLQNILETMESL